MRVEDRRMLNVLELTIVGIPIINLIYNHTISMT
jgi:energy-converting hydrogenase Eha subunit E